jgi:hypothetical protein
MQGSFLEKHILYILEVNITLSHWGLGEVNMASWKGIENV